MAALEPFEAAVVTAVNLIQQSNSFTTAPWAAAVNSTITANSGTSPDGTNDAWLWARTSTASANVSQPVNKTASALVYTFSIYGKVGGTHAGNFLALGMQDSTGAGNSARATFNVSTGVVSIAASTAGNFSAASAAIQAAANGFFRCILTAVTTTDTDITPLFSASTNDVAYDGTDSAANTTMLVFGAQLEQSAVASTYFPTVTTYGKTASLAIGTGAATSQTTQINSAGAMHPSILVNFAGATTGTVAYLRMSVESSLNITATATDTPIMAPSVRLFGNANPQGITNIAVIVTATPTAAGTMWFTAGSGGVI